MDIVAGSYGRIADPGFEPRSNGLTAFRRPCCDCRRRRAGTCARVSIETEGPWTRAWRYLFDALVTAWVVLWIIVGVVTANQVRSLTSVTDTIDLSATTVDRTADALDPLAQLPLVGGRVRETQARIHAAAREALGNSARSRTSIEDLSGLLGWVIAVAPSAPIAVGYVAFRVMGVTRRRRERAGSIPNSGHRGPSLPVEVGL